MTTFEIRPTIRFAWETFQKRPWLFVGVTLLITVINALVSNTFPGVTWTQETGLLADPTRMFGSLVSFILQIFIGMGTIAFYLKAHDDVPLVRVADLWSPERFLQFGFLSIIFAVILPIAFLLLIIPGIILSLMFQFAPYLVIDKRMSAIDALKESARLTSGMKWTLLRFNLMLIGVVILGAICLLVGLLVAIPVTYLAIAHVYRTLEKSEEVSVSNV